MPITSFIYTITQLLLRLLLTGVLFQLNDTQAKIHGFRSKPLLVKYTMDWSVTKPQLTHNNLADLKRYSVINKQNKTKITYENIILSYITYIVYKPRRVPRLRCSINASK